MNRVQNGQNKSEAFFNKIKTKINQQFSGYITENFC